MVLPNAILLVLPRGLGSHRLWSRTSKLMSHGTCHFPLGPTSPNPWQLPQREPHRRLPHSPFQFTVQSSRASAEPLALDLSIPAGSCSLLHFFSKVMTCSIPIIPIALMHSHQDPLPAPGKEPFRRMALVRASASGCCCSSALVDLLPLHVGICV